MARQTWFVRSAAALAITAAAVAVAVGTTAQPAGAAPPGPLEDCDAVPRGPGAGGTWWLRTMELDANGELSGWHLEIGAPGARTRRLGLPAESSVGGPVGGLIVLTADDGHRSSIRVASAAAGCAGTAHGSAEIVRSAVLRPGLEDVYFHLLRRSDRADLGIWRTALGREAGPQRVLGAPDDRSLRRLGAIWATELRFDAPGGRLAVQSCSPIGCLTRVLDLDAGSTTTVADDDQGPIVALAGERLITWATCPGLPCAVLAIDMSTGERLVLHPSAVSVAPLRPDERHLAITATDGRQSIVDPLVTQAMEVVR